jgi:hypothetical protein
MIQYFDKYGNLKVTTSPVTIITGDLNQKSITVEQASGSEKIAIFFTTVALTISKVRAVVRGSGASVTYNIVYGTDISAAGTNVTNAPIAVTDATGGVDAVLDNVSVPINGWVWFITTASSGTVTWINVTIEF